MTLADMRQTYAKDSLLESDAAASPFVQFSHWFEQALNARVPEPNAMTLATVDPDGQPSARIVLIKEFDENGPVFYTNYDSRKGVDLAANPKACLAFFWQALERQVRIEGVIEKVSAAQSDAYYHSRPLASRIGAWASKQSMPVTREALEASDLQYQAQFGEQPPRPEHWGGYRLRPTYFEFWQGRPSRLHDRLSYRLHSDGSWKMTRLSP